MSVSPMSVSWSGVFPAVTTQFAPDLSLDIPGTQAMQKALVDDGVSGLILMGTVGENNSLTANEKRQVLAAAKEAVGGRTILISGVSELTTDAAVAYAKDAEKAGVDGLMVLPAMVYVPSEEELVAHFRAIAQATRLPLMLYNNPAAYRVNLSIPTLRKLAEIPNIAAIKESAPDSRRFTDLINAFGDRFAIFAGLDDVALEGLLLGARGWISGLTNAFPQESLAIVEAVARGDMPKALEIYRWFMPLLHLDADPDLVQTIKLAEQVMGRGSERVRMPRMVLSGARRAEVLGFIEKAAATRPRLK